MNYQTVKRTGYGSRIKNAFGGIFGGIVMIVIGTGLLWWNEGRTVRQSDAIMEAKSATQNVKDISQVDPQLDGKLIHAQGLATTENTIGDSELDILATAIRVERHVEYYQYAESSTTEKEVKFGGEEVEVTTYTYKPKWNSTPIDSHEFNDPDYKNSNFVLAQIEDQTWTAPTVTFGAYELPEFLKSAMSGSKPLAIEHPEDVTKKVKSRVKLSPINTQAYAEPQGQNTPQGNLNQGNQNPASQAHTMSQDMVKDMVHVQSNVIYLGNTSNQPNIGDVKISYTQVLPADISIIAQVTGNTFESFIASNGNSFSKLNMGKVSAESMFEDAHSSNMMLAWILRVVGIVLVIMGFNGILAPLQVLASVVPFLGSIIGAGTGLIAGVLGFVWSLLIIAIAWFRFRPMLSTVLLAIIAGLIYFLYKRGKKAKANDTTPPSTTA